MPNESNFEFDCADKIAIRIVQLINNTSDRTNQEALAGLMMAIADVIGSIDCSDCRADAVEFVADHLPKCIQHATEQAVNRPSNHVH
jgi:hypothetical protein